jgi:DNA-binding GntR family transcriptional regulator
MSEDPGTRFAPFDRSRHAAPQVFERLREMILALELAPGTVLSRAELAARFGLSQTPVRDALMKLGEEGLVDIYPQHATVVSRIDAAAAAQAQFLRRAVEVEIVRTLAARPDPALLDTLRAQIDVQAALMGSPAYLDFIAADRAFHRRMYVAAGVPDLFDLVRQRAGHVDRLRMLNLPTLGKQREIVHDHSRIVDAIASGNAEVAQATVRDHLSGTLSQVESIRQAHPDYFTAQALTSPFAA